MNTNVFLFWYSVFITVILTFLFRDWFKIRRWYLIILINPESHVRVFRFFKEMNSILKKFYPLLEELISHRGRNPVDFKFQFRFLIWWKFFNRKTLNQAIRELNSSEFLRKLLDCPVKTYSREIFHTFRKKVESSTLEVMQEELISEFFNKKILDLKTIILDSFPVKSILNTQKCLKRPPINLKQMKEFIDLLSLDHILEKLKVSKTMKNKIRTKLIALTVKELWDLVSWNKCWRTLYDTKNKISKYSDLHYYSTHNSLRNIEIYLKNQKEGHLIEKLLLDEICRVLNVMNLKKKDWNPKSLTDLNSFFYTPHRFKDPGISIYHCASKDEHAFGRGGLLAVSKVLELPLLIGLTPKYKQSEERIIIFLKKFYKRFKSKYNSSTILADSEFGTKKILNFIESKLNWIGRIPSYGNSDDCIKINKTERDDRKLIERVIGRLVRNWNLERPSHIGEAFANFHLQVAVFCDLLQVKFNFEIGNYAHPHAIKGING